MRQFQLKPISSELHAALETIARHARHSQEANEWIDAYMHARGSEFDADRMIQTTGRLLAIAVAATETREGLVREHCSNPDLQDRPFEFPFEDLEDPLVPVKEPRRRGLFMDHGSPGGLSEAELIAQNKALGRIGDSLKNLRPSDPSEEEAEEARAAIRMKAIADETRRRWDSKATP